MVKIIQPLFSYEALINVISCVITALALAFTLYLWLINHLSEDESKFIEVKEKFLEELRGYLVTISGNKEPQVLLPIVQKVNNKLEVILSYRFWVHSKKKEDYKEIKRFYIGSKYLISTIRRYVDVKEKVVTCASLVRIDSIKDEYMEEIQNDYRNGLIYIIDFLESWN